MNYVANLRRFGILSSIGLVAMLGACGDDDKKTDTTDVADTRDGSETTPDVTEETTPDATGEATPDVLEETSPDVTPDTTETTYATLTFSIDDSANKTFTAADKLVWKGSMTYNAATNVATFDSSWGGGSGPYAPLWDDGPAPGGHEKPGAVAGDGIWTLAVKVATPTADQTFEYGAAYGDGAGSWIWNGNGNGTVVVPAGSTGQVDATGMTISKHGTIDLLLTLDASDDGANLDPTFQGVTYNAYKVKGSAWGWGEIAMVDDGTKGDATAGDKIYTFRMSDNLGKHDGLLKPGDVAQFVFVFDDSEYKGGVDAAIPLTQGVAAWLSDGTNKVEATIANLPTGDKNTYVEVPTKVEVSFTVDDSVNKTYEASDALEWKGSFVYDDATDMIAFDSTWTGPYVPLFDDGPGPIGHEPAGAVAGDSKWSNSVWVSNAGGDFAYGAQRAGGSWIWVGGDGTFAVSAGTLAPIVAPGLTIAPFGTIDLRLEIDVSNEGQSLDPSFQGEDYTDQVEVKGSAWAWGEIMLTDDGMGGDLTAGDGIYTFLLSEHLGKHDSLLKPGDQAQFVFVLGSLSLEYKVDGIPSKTGISAWLIDGGIATPATISNLEGTTDQNTYVQVPE